jgi:hypothetical protein
LEKGFSTKSKAPRLTAATAVGTSPWPVRKITGSTGSNPRSARRSNSTRPLVPGMRTSSTRQAGALGKSAMAGCRSGGDKGLEGIGAVKALGQQAARTQQPGQGVAHHFLVVHQVDNGYAEGGVQLGQGHASGWR